VSPLWRVAAAAVKAERQPFAAGLTQHSFIANYLPRGAKQIFMPLHSEHPFRKSRGTVFSLLHWSIGIDTQRRNAMRKLVLSLAALAAIGVAMPLAANAETVIIKKHHEHAFPPPPVVFHRDDGPNKTVIIKHDND
jgi:hypothetical protein